MSTQRHHRSLGFAALVALALAAPTALAQTDISNQPLAQPASNVKPNVMLILDDSGSMREQYTPDYMGSLFGSAAEMCYDSKDTGGSIGSTLEDCEVGDPPMMSPEVNYQYYNPEIRYFPAVNYDGTSKGDMTAAATSNWTAVPTDNVSNSGKDTYRVTTLAMNAGGNGATTANLVTGYPDRAWCTSTGDNQNTLSNYPNKCRLNSQYNYPNANYGYGRDGSGNIKYVFRAPYYYRLLATEYCTDATLTTCINSTVPTAAYPVAAPLRFCTDTTLTTCGSKLTGAYTRPKYSGKVVAGGTPGTAKVATATITVKNPQADSYGGTISAIYINGMNVITAPISQSNNFSPSSAAVAVRDAINTNSGTSGYSASVSNNVVTVYANPTTGTPYACASASPQTCTVPNGYVVSLNSVGTPTTQASITFDVVDVDNNEYVNSVSVGTTTVVSSTIYCTSGTGCAGNNQTGRDNWMGSKIAQAINAGTATHGYSATTTSNGSRVTIIAPAGTGSEMNGLPLTVIKNNNLQIQNVTGGGKLTGGATSGDIETVATNFSGGTDDNEGRIEIGRFVRFNIVPFQDPPTNSIPSTYTKYAKRTDCASGVCTYAEEMTNFANWYAYYRSRMQMAKTSIGRAFAAIDDSYRVGFITINPGSSVQSDRYLKIDTFDVSQKKEWYERLYDQTDHGSTPLREALSRVGRYYAGVKSGINDGMDDSPIQVSCQPNYTILTTDGYWNGNAGQSLTGGAIGNQDNVNAGYSTRAVGAFDGALPGAKDTLADVAMYYYKNDLRSDLADNSPTTQKDSAPHQHMVTFTVGLGLAGLLNYDKNYEEQTTGDFIAIKQGTKDWPVPAADSESALDDLWHAAVNGRGTFFSTRDPAQLTSGVAEALNSVQSRVGAGAAAATSNLQPVAGDNFAFTAQYQTVVWTGDLKARTIDLSTGIVANRELWSAAVSLDQRNHTDRKIYMFDANDTAPAAPGENGNLLKAFCWPGAGGTGLYPGCVGEAELSATEMAWFDPTLLTQYGGWTVDGSGRDTAVSAPKLIDFLRGDVANETTGGTALTDLFRDRDSLLGDIVNAQPAYVKASPFSYNIGANLGKDPYYQEYKQTTDGTTGTRKGTVFGAANDGMLHAFETDPDNNPYYQTAGITTATTSDDTFTGTLNTSPTAGEGAERWAYIPSMVGPKLKALAETPLLFVHQYYTDGSPVVGDVCYGHSTSTPCASQNNWHTILVAGLNAGGRGYYALDITDPDNPKGMWEFKGGALADPITCGLSDSAIVGYTSDCNLGYSFGTPVIAKRKYDGKWVVMITSGHNNVNPGDGKGYLYLLDAQTGTILQRIGTGVGCDGVSTTSPCTAGTIDPSGLSKFNAWVDDASFDNTALAAYAGDLKGNLWRFQLDPSETGYGTAYKIVTLVDSTNKPQPVTTKPELGVVSNFRVVFVGTGKLLGTTDLVTTDQQTIYAIRDDLTSNAIDLRGGDLVQQTLSTLSSNTRTATANPVDFNTNKGWYVDLPDSGERVNVDPVLQLGTLVFPSNVPSNDACVAGGYGWINFLDFRTGSFIPGATLNTASNKISASLVVGINVVQLPGGAVKTIVTTADNQQITQETPVAPPAIEGKRVSWRELIVQ
jgi:type IV pilus assembly protein PilY1